MQQNALVVPLYVVLYSFSDCFSRTCRSAGRLFQTRGLWLVKLWLLYFVLVHGTDSWLDRWQWLELSGINLKWCSFCTKMSEGVSTVSILCGHLLSSCTLHCATQIRTLNFDLFSWKLAHRSLPPWGMFAQTLIFGIFFQIRGCAGQMERWQDP